LRSGRLASGLALLTILLATAFAANASAAGIGGIEAATAVSNARTGGASPSSSKGAKPTVPPGAAPITAKTPALAYTGPVYEKTAEGQVVPYQPPVALAAQASSTGGSAAELPSASTPELLVPGSLAHWVEGFAAAPMSAPAAVQEIIWTANQLIGLPYIYGGGHASFASLSPGYDCSGTVSWALHGGKLLKAPEDSSELESFGAAGVGRWVTIFSNPGHAYMTVAGLRLDTSSADDPSNEQGPRWRPLRPANAGYVVRHPVGL